MNDYTEKERDFIMSEEKEYHPLTRFFSGLLTIALFVGVFYVVSFGVFYFTADEVECGNIGGVVPYCSGTYESSVVQRNITETCYVNGKEVNCSQIEKKYESFPEVYN